MPQNYIDIEFDQYIENEISAKINQWQQVLDYNFLIHKLQEITKEPRTIKAILSEYSAEYDGTSVLEFFIEGQTQKLSVNVRWAVDIDYNSLKPTFDESEIKGLPIPEEAIEDVISQLKDKAFTQGQEDLNFIRDSDGMWNLHTAILNAAIKKLKCDPEGEEGEGYRNIFDLALPDFHWVVDITDLVGSCINLYVQGLNQDFFRYVQQLLIHSQDNLAQSVSADLYRQTYIADLRVLFLQAKQLDNVLKMHQILLAISQSIRLIMHYKVEKFFKSFDTHYGYQSDELLLDYKSEAKEQLAVEERSLKIEDELPTVSKPLDFLSEKYTILEEQVSLKEKFNAIKKFIKVIPHSSSSIQALEWQSSIHEGVASFDLRPTLLGLQDKARAFNDLIKERLTAFREQRQKDFLSLKEEIEKLMIDKQEFYKSQAEQFENQAKVIGQSGNGLDKKSEEYKELCKQWKEAMRYKKQYENNFKQMEKLSKAFIHPDKNFETLRKAAVPFINTPLYCKLDEYMEYRMPDEYVERNIFLPVFIFCLSSPKNKLFIPVGLSIDNSPFMVSADLEDNVFEEDMQNLNPTPTSRKEKFELQREARILSAIKEDKAFLKVSAEKSLEYSLITHEDLEFVRNNPDSTSSYFQLCQHSERVFSRTLRSKEVIQKLVESLYAKVCAKYGENYAKFTVSHVTLLAYSLNRVCDTCTRDLVSLTHDWTKGAESDKSFMTLLAEALKNPLPGSIVDFLAYKPSLYLYPSKVLTANTIVIADQQYPRRYESNKQDNYEQDDAHGLEVDRHPSSAIARVDVINFKSPVYTTTFVEQLGFKPQANTIPLCIPGNFFVSGSPIMDYAGVDSKQNILPYAQTAKIDTDKQLQQISKEFEGIKLEDQGSIQHDEMKTYNAAVRFVGTTETKENINLAFAGGALMKLMEVKPALTYLLTQYIPVLPAISYYFNLTANNSNVVNFLSKHENLLSTSLHLLGGTIFTYNLFSNTGFIANIKKFTIPLASSVFYGSKQYLYNFKSNILSSFYDQKTSSYLEEGIKLSSYIATDVVASVLTFLPFTIIAGFPSSIFYLVMQGAAMGMLNYYNDLNYKQYEESIKDDVTAFVTTTAATSFLLHKISYLPTPAEKIIIIANSIQVLAAIHFLSKTLYNVIEDCVFQVYNSRFLEDYQDNHSDSDIYHQ